MVSRRQLLCSLPLVAVAGCTERAGVGSGPGTPTPTATDSPTPTDTPEPTLAPDTVLLTVTDGESEVDLLTVGGVAEVGAVGEARTSAYYVPITLTGSARSSFAETLGEVGAYENPEAHDIRTYVDGEVVFTATLSPGLAEAIESGEWEGTFRLTTDEESTARTLHDALA
jgi:hypothetical protein